MFRCKYIFYSYFILRYHERQGISTEETSDPNIRGFRTWDPQQNTGPQTHQEGETKHPRSGLHKEFYGDHGHADNSRYGGIADGRANYHI